MLEYYLKSSTGALRDELNGLSRTYVVIDEDLEYIVGYFSLKAGQNHLIEGVLWNKKKYVFPGVELVMFAVNDNYREMAQNNTSLGEWLFYAFVLPKIKEASDIIGIKQVYIFALPYKPKLIAFYKRLGFVNPRYSSDYKKKVRTIIPQFDRGCVFMIQNL